MEQEITNCDCMNYPKAFKISRRVGNQQLWFTLRFQRGLVESEAATGQNKTFLIINPSQSKPVNFLQRVSTAEQLKENSFHDWHDSIS